MEKELAQGNLGSIGKYDVDFKGGAIVAAIEFEKGPASMKLEAVLDGKSVAIAALDFIAEKIPGNLEDGVIKLLKEKLAEL